MLVDADFVFPEVFGLAGVSWYIKKIAMRKSAVVFSVTLMK